jgi:uncharacterized SAM-binding protein YcdF (DUF218 family)
VVALAWSLQLPRPALPAAALLTPLALSALYSPAATALLSGWLTAQLPAPVFPPTGGDPAAQPVVMLVGRGPAIAAATTEAAADRFRRGQALAAYVSGDERATADRLVALTAAWLRQRHPGAPVLLITDPWQLPRAVHAFQRQGLQVQPLAAEPPLAPVERNRLALRETAATLPYRLQGRM